MDKGEHIEIISPHAFDEHLPARLPVRGLDGEIMSAVIADVTRDESGLIVTLANVVTTGEPLGELSARPLMPPISFEFKSPTYLWGEHD